MGRRVVPKSDREVRMLTHGTVKGARSIGEGRKREVGEPGNAYHAVGGEGAHGLVLVCQPPTTEGVRGARSWLLRYSFNGRQREMGLGAYPAVSLSRAREKAREIRAGLAEGVDPLDARRKSKEETRKQTARAVTFERLAIEYMDMRRAHYDDKPHAVNSIKKVEKETSQLRRYVFPELGGASPGELTPEDVANVLRPIRLAGKRETESQVRRNLAQIMDLARARGLTERANPVDLRVLRNLLPETPAGKMRKLEAAQALSNHPALDVAELPRFITRLREDGALGAQALLFQILTATRPGEARLAKWADVDLEAAVWRIPAEDMKTGEAHDVPLSRAAVAMLEGLPRRGVYIFSVDGTRPVSNNTANQRIKAIHTMDIALGNGGFVDSAQSDKAGNHPRAVAHGFRSTFKDWSRTVERFSDELTELALAHRVRLENSKVREAYARDKLVSQRRPIMEAWAKYCGLPTRPGQVIEFKRGAK